jgi:hypothetical protein
MVPGMPQVAETNYVPALLHSMSAVSGSLQALLEILDS